MSSLPGLLRQNKVLPGFVRCAQTPVFDAVHGDAGFFSLSQKKLKKGLAILAGV